MSLKPRPPLDHVGAGALAGGGTSPRDKLSIPVNGAPWGKMQSGNPIPYSMVSPGSSGRSASGGGESVLPPPQQQQQQHSQPPSPSPQHALADATSAGHLLACLASFGGRDPLSIAEPILTVFVGSLPRSTDRAELVHFFSAAGALKGIHYDGGSYGFIEYQDLLGATSALKLFHNTLFPGTQGGTRLAVVASLSMTRLFIGGIATGLEPRYIFDSIRNMTEVRR